MEPRVQNLNVTDGQLAAESAIITAGPASKSRRINVTFANVGETSETVTLTLSVGDGGTQRRIRRFTLDANEQADLRGLAVDESDTLYGFSTTAEAVDYVVSMCPPEGAGGAHGPSLVIYDEDGVPKAGVYSVLEALQLSQ